jgi:hypothetical protein
MWYQQGYRANIVTYTIGLLRHLIKKQFPKQTLNLGLIWNRQEVPQVLSKQMALLAKAVMESITDESRETANVTQWCKRDACWKRARELPVQLHAALESVLMDTEEAKAEGRSAKKEQQMVAGIDTQTDVVNRGALFWKGVMDFLVAKRLLSPQDLTALRIAAQMPAKLPTEYQCQRLLGLIQRAAGEGHVG